MAESIFEQNLKARADDQKNKAANCGLEKRAKMDQIHMSIPSDLKERFTSYCERNHTKPSEQLKRWIIELCD